MSEVVSIEERCMKCGTATAVLVHHTGLTYSGEPWEAYMLDKPEHGRAECARMVTLSREQWPTLW